MNALTPIDLNQPLAVYAPFRAELATLSATNASMVFDYEDPKGNKDARSHIHKLRLSAGAVEKKRKEAKADSLAYGRKIDVEAAEIDGEIRAMIDVHEKPLKAIEEREAKRQAAIDEQIKAIQADGALNFTAGSGAIESALARVEAVALDLDAFGKRLPDVTQAKEAAVRQLGAALLAAKAMEVEKAELEQLRKEKAETEAREVGERAQRAAAEKERLAKEAELEEARREQAAAEKRAADAEAAAKRQAEEAAENARREQELAEKRAADAEAEAKRRAEEAVAAERQRVEDEARQQREAEEARQRNEEQRAAVHAAIVEALSSLSNFDVQSVFAAIRDGQIPHVSITY